MKKPQHYRTTALRTNKNIDRKGNKIQDNSIKIKTFRISLSYIKRKNENNGYIIQRTMVISSKIDLMVVVWWRALALDVRHLEDALHLCAATIRTNSGPVRDDERQTVLSKRKTL